MIHQLTEISKKSDLNRGSSPCIEWSRWGDSRSSLWGSANDSLTLWRLSFLWNGDQEFQRCLDGSTPLQRRPRPLRVETHPAKLRDVVVGGGSPR